MAASEPHRQTQDEEARLRLENRRLREQAAWFGADEFLELEAARWRHVDPGDRVAEVERLCSLIPYWQALPSFPAQPPPSPPAEVMAVLREIKAQADAYRRRG